MSEPPDKADPKPDDTLPPLDAEAELVTDPIALTMGATGPLKLPEPMLGSDEDDPSAGFGAGRPSFLAALEARNGPHEADDGFALEAATEIESETEAAAPPADEPAANPNAPVLVSE